jgi:hypothetical protein
LSNVTPGGSASVSRDAWAAPRAIGWKEQARATYTECIAIECELPNAADAQMNKLQVGALAVCAAMYAGVVVSGWPDLVFAVALEDSPLAWMQAAALVACATVAASCAATEQGRTAHGWSLIALALLAAALDERFMGHERVQAGITHLLGGSAAAKRASQLLLVSYIPVGMFCVRWLHREMDRRAWRWCGWALAVGTAALAMDVAFVTASPAVIEETLEFVAEALMLTGLLSELHIRASRLR